MLLQEFKREGKSFNQQIRKDITEQATWKLDLKGLIEFGYSKMEGRTLYNIPGLKINMSKDLKTGKQGKNMQSWQEYLFSWGFGDCLKKKFD